MDGDTTIMSDTTQDLLENKNEPIVDSFLLGERVNPVPKQKSEETLLKETLKNCLNSGRNNHFNTHVSNLVTSTPYKTVVPNQHHNHISSINHTLTDPSQQRENSNSDSNMDWKQSTILLERLKNSKPLLVDNPINDSSSDALTDDDEQTPTNPSKTLNQTRISSTLKSGSNNVRELYNKNDNLEKENFSLKLRIFHMQQELDTFHGSPEGKNYVDYLNDNLNLKVKMGEMDEELEKNRGLLASAHACIKQMQDSHNAQVQAKQAAELALQTKRANDLDNQLAATKHSFLQTKSELDQMKNDHSQFADLSKRVRDLTLESALAKNQRDSAQQQAQLLADQNSRYEKDALAETQSRVSALLCRVEDADNKLKRMDQEKSDLQRGYELKILNGEKDFRNYRLQHDERMRLKESELAQMESNYNTEKVRYERERRLREALESRAGAERSTLTNKDSVIQSLTDNLSQSKTDLVVLRNKNQSLEHERSILADRVNSLTSQINSLQHTRAPSPVNLELEKKLDLATRKAQDLALQLSDKRILEERLERVTSQFEKKSRDLGELQRRYQVLLTSNKNSDEIFDLKHKIKLLEEELKGRNQLIADLQAKPTTPRSRQYKIRSDSAPLSPTGQTSPYLKRENDLLKDQLIRARKMIRSLKINCQELIECTQLALQARNENNSNFPLTTQNIDWQSKFDTLKEQIIQKTPLMTPERNISNPLADDQSPLNVSSARRRLFDRQEPVNKIENQNAEIQRLKIQNQMLQKRIEESRSGLLTPPEDRSHKSGKVYTNRADFDFTKQKLQQSLLGLKLLKTDQPNADTQSLQLALGDIKKVLDQNFFPMVEMASSGFGSNGLTSPSQSQETTAELKSQLGEAKAKLKLQEHEIKKTMNKLAKSQKVKHQFEDKIRKQLELTKGVLQKANVNLKEEK